MESPKVQKVSHWLSKPNKGHPKKPSEIVRWIHARCFPGTAALREIGGCSGRALCITRYALCGFLYLLHRPWLCVMSQVVCVCSGGFGDETPRVLGKKLMKELLFFFVVVLFVLPQTHFCYSIFSRAICHCFGFYTFSLSLVIFLGAWMCQQSSTRRT